MDDLPGGPVVKTSPSNVSGFNRWLGTKTPHASRLSKQKKKKHKTKAILLTDAIKTLKMVHIKEKMVHIKKHLLKKTDMDPTFIVFLAISFLLPYFFLGFLPASDDDDDDG